MSSPQIKHEEASLVINKDDNFEYQHTIDYLGENGYIRVSNVRETGEFSVKGDVIDIFPSGYDNPVRVDIFGNDIEKLQIFYPFLRIKIYFCDSNILIYGNL